MRPKALVCGGHGFIGHHLAQYLMVHDYWVRTVDINDYVYGDLDVDDYVVADLRDPNVCDQVTRAPDGKPFDEVYQMAAWMGGAGVIFTGDNDATVMHDSMLINLNMAEACRKNRAGSVFYSSSACMYNHLLQLDTDNPGLKEDMAYPAYPDSVYGWEKLAAEQLWQAYARNHGMNVKIARFHNVFGIESAWDNGKEKSPAAMCRKVARAKNGDTIQVWGDGCFPSGELVYTPKGLKPIETLKKGEEVLGRGGFQNIKAVMSREYNGRLFSIKAEGALPFRCTDEHPILVKRLLHFCRAHGPHWCKPNCFCRKYTCAHEIKSELIWVKPHEIDVGRDFLCLPRIRESQKVSVDLRQYCGGHTDFRPQEQPVISQFEIDENWSWILGLYLAEGWSSVKNKKIQWCLGWHEEELVAELMDKLTKVGLRSWTDRLPSKPSSIAVNVSSRPLAKWLQDKFGTNAKRKIVPYEFFLFEECVAREFIEGYFRGDGMQKIEYDSGRKKISSSSKSALVGIQILLNKFGNHGSIFWKDQWYTKPELSGGRISYADHPKNVHWFKDEELVYVPMDSVEESTYDGIVHNIETENNTFATPAIVHNSQTRSFLYIDECLCGIRRLMDSDFAGPVNIGSDYIISINDLVEMVKDIAGKPNITINHVPGPLGVRGRTSDNTLIKEKLDWAPSQPLRVGMEQLYAWIDFQVKQGVRDVK